MRKMYFAMIPKRSFLEDAAIVAGLGAGLIYGAKWLLGEQKFGEYKQQLKDRIFGGTKTEFNAQGPDTGSVIGGEGVKAQEEENILERIRRAAKK